MIALKCGRPPNDVTAIASRIDATRQSADTAPESRPMLEEQMLAAALCAVVSRLGQIRRMPLQPFVGAFMLG